MLVTIHYPLSDEQIDSVISKKRQLTQEIINSCPDPKMQAGMARVNKKTQARYEKRIREALKTDPAIRLAKEVDEWLWFIADEHRNSDGSYLYEEDRRFVKVLLKIQRLLLTLPREKNHRRAFVMAATEIERVVAGGAPDSLDIRAGDAWVDVTIGPA